MWNDELVEEIRKTREEHAAKFNYDLAAIYQDLRKQQQQGGREVVRLTPKRPIEVIRKAS